AKGLNQNASPRPLRRNRARRKSSTWLEASARRCLRKNILVMSAISILPLVRCYIHICTRNISQPGCVRSLQAPVFTGTSPVRAAWAGKVLPAARKLVKGGPDEVPGAARDDDPERGSHPRCSSPQPRLDRARLLGRRARERSRRPCRVLPALHALPAR